MFQGMTVFLAVCCVFLVHHFSLLSWQPSLSTLGSLGLILAWTAYSEWKPVVLAQLGTLTFLGAGFIGVWVAAGLAPALALVALAHSVRFYREYLDRGTLNPHFVAYSFGQATIAFIAAGCVLEASRSLQINALGVALASALSLSVAYAVEIAFASVAQWYYQGKVGVWLTRANYYRLFACVMILAPIGSLTGIIEPLGMEWLVLFLIVVSGLHHAYLDYSLAAREVEQLVQGLVQAVENREPHLLGHAYRVAELAQNIARELHVSEWIVDEIRHAARLHDLGKIGIDEEVLQKKSCLSQLELDVIRRYPEIGATMVHQFLSSDKIADYIRYHHEHIDGTGYPHGLKDTEIPLGAKIISVAEAFDSLMTDRPYRSGYSKDEAIDLIRSEVGTRYDANVFSALSEVVATQRNCG